MDKETLSNYGWIVICVLVLAVMIALATPFGRYIEQAVWNTAEGLFDTSEKALNVVGMSAKEPVPTITYPNLKDKRICIIGTNISSTSYEEINYVESISTANNMTTFDYSGNTDVTWLLSRVERKIDDLQALGFNKDDYVIFEGMLTSCDMDLGELTPVGTTTFDTTTFIGAFEKTIFTYQKSGLQSKTGVILTHFSDNERIQNEEKYWDAAISVCNKYGISYLDLRNKQYSLQADRILLTQDAHAEMAIDVALWLQGLS